MDIGRDCAPTDVCHACYPAGSKMTNQVSSQAHFRAGAAEYELPKAFLDLLEANGIKSMGSMAFAISRPGSDFNEQEFDNWARDLNGGRLPAMGVMSALRRLHFESEIILTATLRSAVESPDSSTPRVMPFAERNARLDQLRTRFTGLNIHGAGEPSHTMLDEICAQFEQRALKYVEPAKCTSRETEIITGKT